MKLTLRQKRLLYICIVGFVLMALLTHAFWTDKSGENIQTMTKTEVGIYANE